MDHPDLPTGRRAFSEAPAKRSRLRDTDSAQNIVRLRALTNGVFGGVLGGLLAYFLVSKGGPIWLFLVLPLVGWAFVSASVYLLATSAGGAASNLYAPGSGSTPRPREYSQAESMVARGLYPEAVTAFELAVQEDPSDPTPYLRVARIYRDHLRAWDDSARWFRRALRESTIPAGQAHLARKELIELYTHRMGAPEKALPELARMAHELEGTPEGAWAEGELRSIKEGMARGREGAGGPGSTPPG